MPAKLPVLTLLTLLGFAGNSILCRLALKHTGIDAASFTAIRLVSGAVMLWVITQGKSGIVYAVWYTVLPHFKSSTAATLQLSVPVLAAVGGILFLHEPITLRLFVASVMVLGGIALVVLNRQSV